MVASPLNATPGQMLAFVRRQYLMGRFYLPRWWALMLLLATLVTLPPAVNLAMFVYTLAIGSVWAWMFGALSAVLYGLSLPTGLFRQSLVRLYCPEYEDESRRDSLSVVESLRDSLSVSERPTHMISLSVAERPTHYAALREARRFEVWAGPLVGAVNWIELLASAVGRRVTWRGIGYRLDADGQVIRVWHDELPIFRRPEQPAAAAFRETDAGPAVLPFPSDLVRAA